MNSKPTRWNTETDVLVIGSGGSGMTAGITAHDNGAEVIIMEKSAKAGGTTAISGGGVWIPVNHHMAENGFKESREEALRYCLTLTRGRVAEELVETFLDTGPEMISYMEEHTPLKFECSLMPDYHPELEGGHSGEQSRTLGPLLFDSNGLGDWLQYLRSGPLPSYPMLFSETAKLGRAYKPDQVQAQLIAERMKKGLLGFGRGLAGAMFKGCIDRSIEMLFNTRALELVMEDDQVIGLRASSDGEDFNVRVKKGVILASGGFEWNDELRAAFLPGPITHPNTPPANEGDGLKMAMAAGAALGNMSEVWGWTSMQVPGEEYDGCPASRNSLVERAMPHCIIVNRNGNRFVNEAASYNDMFKSFWITEPNNCEYVNIPAWHIFDQQFKDKYQILSVVPGNELPSWVDRADTLDELALKAGIDTDGLRATVSRFNDFAVTGVDHDFQRGWSIYDKYWADPNHHPNPCLGTIEKPPFYALPAYCGTLGTKGGPKTNVYAQVMHIGGRPIPGLYAAGNVMASIAGPSYWGGGATIGPGMTFGYIAGKHASRR